ncbi:MAG: 2-phospho-L-lactate guanylyltransferase [Actinobacteria bacterium]|nr:2-phospho-L-lactate guanylyltransferase [Actinomycetota bacterium]
MAVVPFRAPGRGKTRLEVRAGAPGLSPSQRATLSRAMLADVSAALACSSVDRVVVAAAGRRAAAAAAALGLEVRLDPPEAHGLNAALAAVTTQLDAATMVVVAADLPSLRGDEVDALLATDADVAVAPTADGGTGGLVRRPPDVIPAAYGVGSAARHRALAAAARLRSAEHDLPGFRRDVDTWEDLYDLLTGPVGAATAAVLARLSDRLLSQPPASGAELSLAGLDDLPQPPQQHVVAEPQQPVDHRGHQPV